MKKYLHLLLPIFYIFILNTIFSLLLFKNLSLTNIIFFLIESLIFGSIIGIISNITNKIKINKTIRITLIAIIGILFAAQFVHYNFYECFFSLYSLSKGGQVLAFLEAIFKIIYENIIGFILLLLIMVIAIILIIKIKSPKERKNLLFLGIINVSAVLIFFLLITFLNNGLYSPHSLMKNINNETRNVKTFGLLTGMSTDIKRNIINFNPNIIINNKNNSTTYDSKNYNIMDIDFGAIIKEEKNETLKELSTYLKNEIPTNKNKYTGIFKGKNLIFITAESFNFNIIDKELTPTLYKLKNEGLYFNNFYTPIYYASTSDGEYTNLTGLIPKEGTWSYIESKNNYYPYSYGEIFNNLGYDTYSYHNGIYDFYDRYEVMKNFGYNNFKACGNGLEKYINCSLWPQSDEEMLKSTFKDYKNSSNFAVYYMSISGHLSHDFKTNDMAKKWQKKVENLKYSNNVKAYISGNIDLDKALENLLQNLEKEKLIDNTVIVIVPDHFPYGLNREELKEIESLETNYDLHKSGLIIYNKKQKPEIINTYASNIDILPTLLNMFGVNYDSRLLTGKDIMSNSEKIIIFNDQSFLTEKGYYNAKTDTFSKKVEKKYLENKQLEVYNKVNSASLILNLDYYKYLENKKEN